MCVPASVALNSSSVRGFSTFGFACLEYTVRGFSVGTKNRFSGEVTVAGPEVSEVHNTFGGRSNWFSGVKFSEVPGVTAGGFESSEVTAGVFETSEVTGVRFCLLPLPRGVWNRLRFLFFLLICVACLLWGIFSPLCS